MKKYSKRILAGIMSFVMLLTMAFPVSVQAEDDGSANINSGNSLDLTGSTVYAMVANRTGKAVNYKKVAANDYQQPVDITAYVFDKDKKISDNASKIKITGTENTEVKIELENSGNLRMESGSSDDNAKEHAFIRIITNDGDDDEYKFILEEDEKNAGKYYIKSKKTERYATVDENNTLAFLEANNNTKGNDTFSFIKINNTESDNDGYDLFDPSFSIKQENGNYIKAPDTETEVVYVNGTESDGDKIKFTEAAFGTEGDRRTVGLFFKSFNDILMKSGGVDKVIGSAPWVGGRGSGYECIRVIPNNDGTISFKDSQGNNPIFVNNSFELEKSGEKMPDKFLIYTDIPPSPVTGIEADDTNTVYSSVKLTWQNPKCLFTGIGIYYKKSSDDDTSYKKAENVKFDGLDLDNGSCLVTGLELDQEYDFRVCVIGGIPSNGGDNLEEDGTIIKNVKAKEGIKIGNVTGGKRYAIVSKDKGKAISKIEEYRYNVITKVNGYANIGENKVGNDAQIFTINIYNQNEKKVNITIEDKDDPSIIRYFVKEDSTDATAIFNAFVEPEAVYSETNNNDSKRQFILEEQDGVFKIKSVADGKYAKVDDDGIFRFDETGNPGVFLFIGIEDNDSNVVVPPTPTPTPPSAATTPPASGTATPPASGTATPPASGTATPPVSGTATPPASGTTPAPGTGPDESDAIVSGGDYAIISKTTGFALNTKANTWTKGSIMADADFVSGKLTSANAYFTIKKTTNAEIENKDAVMLICHFGKEAKSMMVEGDNEFAFYDQNNRSGGENHFILENAGDGTYRIKTYSKNKYATVDPGTNEIQFKADTTAANAEKFIFKKDPAMFDSSIYIQNVASKKFVRTYAGDNMPLTVNGMEKGEDGTVFSKLVFGTNNNTESGDEYVTASFLAQFYNEKNELFDMGLKSVTYDVNAGNSAGAKLSKVFTYKGEKDKHGNGWESIRIVPNEDGTFSFKDSYFGQYITVKGINLVCGSVAQDTTSAGLTDKEKFYICTDFIPDTVENLGIDDISRTTTTLHLSWKNPSCLYNRAVIEQKPAGAADSEYKEIAKLGDETGYTVTGLTKGTEYEFRIHVEFFNGTDTYSSKYAAVKGSTTETERPSAPSNVHVKESAAGVLELSWNKTEGASGYYVYEARSRYDKDGYKLLGYFTNESVVIPTASEPGNTEGRDKYSYYFYVEAVAGSGASSVNSQKSDFVSLETELFGSHTIFFAETDDVKEIDKRLEEIFEEDNDYKNDAQFNGVQYQVYFKPGDYRQTSCMYLGFYTSFNGLGKTPYDVKLNNIAIPAYLPNGALGAGENNATCNFWRSAENLSIMYTGNPQGRAKEKDKMKAGQDCFRPESFNWAVAQAAPLRRVYSERPVAYDWNFGWASGGYVADCYFIGSDSSGSAGTSSGQQFFTRNSKLDGDAYGTTLNNFLLGVEAENNLKDDGKTGKALRSGNGYTNWGISGNNGDQQVTTDITSTPKISEKPFLYLDNGEYKVFVPAVQENRRGISWGEGMDNEGMGKGKSLSLSDFYIAYPSDTAAKINEQIKAGKNIYFTPGIYRAETPIVVDRENAILLGSGMTSIIPDNEEMAMEVYDLDGIRIEGLIFDAGIGSKYLLKVGESKTSKSHSDNPLVLQDLFFRVGGTTKVLTKADDALEINCNDVICDHFWIWRADHGAGVEWYGNESKHGLIVNGDRVKCYALFNEHFQEYHTLWNGEDGETYFYQNETCYDPISQEAWMSHNGTVKGYSSYKVSNDVKKHYAAGLGIYNVFIYTGPLYDAKGVGIQLDNAIEVPNSPDVMVENACIQTFANDDGALARINHIINGVGGSASSGHNSETGETGEGWSRKFLLYYNNGLAEYGKETTDSSQAGKFIGTEVRTNSNPVEQPADEKIYIDKIEQLYKELSKAVEKDYTKGSWKIAELENALKKAEEMIRIGKQMLKGEYDPSARLRRQTEYSQSLISQIQTEINKACTTLEAAGERLVYIGDAVRMEELCNINIEPNKDDYESNSQWTAYKNALETVQALLDANHEKEITEKKEIYQLQVDINAAYDALRRAVENLVNKDLGVIVDLQAAYDKSLLYNKEDYIEAGWADFEAARNAAKAQIDKGVSGEQADIDSALAELNTAMSKLANKPASEDVNISGLKMLYDRYSGYKSSDYESGWEDFTRALNAANELLGSSNATQNDIEGAITALLVAEANLVKKPESTPGSIDNSKLQAAYDKYVVYKQSDYTAGSWAGFASALLNAKNQLDKGTGAAQADIDKAYTELIAAEAKLVKNAGGTGNADNSKLQAAYDKYAAYKQSDYTAGSWAGFASALLNAKNQLDKGTGATQADIDKALEELNKAASNLIKQSGNQGGGSGGSSLDNWLSGVLSGALNNNSDSDKNNILDAIKDLTDTKSEMDETQKKADELLNAINDALNSNGGNETDAEGIVLNKYKLSINKGGKAVLKATVMPENASNKSVVWSSSDTKVVTVDNNGNIKAVGKGTANITAATPNGFKAVCKVTVKIPATKVTLNKQKVYIVKGESLKLKAVVSPSGTTGNLKWNTSKASVVSVNSNGRLKAKKTGTAVITVTATGGKTAKCKVYVVKKAKKADSASFKKKKVSVKKGNWILLNVVLKPVVSTDIITWKSSNKKIASVDAYGFVTAKKKGSVTITATTENGKKVTCKVTVKE